MRHDHIISAKQLSRVDIEAVLDHAADIAADPGAYADRHAGTLLGLLFFEPSTRTKMSFTAAMKRLGGDIVDMGSVESSSVKKGESLADTVRVVEGYADALVLRHPMEGSAKMASEFVDVPLVNAGDGAGQHPTQTLLDLYTIRENAGFDDVTVGIMEIRPHRPFAGPRADQRRRPPAFHQPGVAPATALGPVRPPSGGRRGAGTHRTGGGPAGTGRPLRDPHPARAVPRRGRVPRRRQYQIDGETLEAAKDDLTVMHPLPRVDEIAHDIDDTDYATYFEQAHNGVPVRMALLDLLLDTSEVTTDE